MKVANINGEEGYIMYNLCFNNWTNIDNLSNENVTLKCRSSADGTMHCDIKTKDETINLEGSDNYLLGMNCFGHLETYKGRKLW